MGQYKSCSVPGTVALTFDDGPHLRHTMAILKIADMYGFKVTLFVTGKLLDPTVVPILQYALDNGHQIASHSYNHNLLTSLTATEVEEDFTKFETAFASLNLQGSSIHQNVPSYLRAPHGAVNDVTAHVAKKMGYTLIHWGYLNGDTSALPVSEDEVLAIHMEHMGGENGTGVDPKRLNTIIQQHDSKTITYNSFPAVAKYLHDNFATKGTKFVTIAECLNNVVPPYHKRPSRLADPTCAYGIKNKHICCPKSCTRCGGDKCSTLPGGSKNCCFSRIQETSVACDTSIAPCVLKHTTELKKKKETTIDSDPLCAHGIKSSKVCCPKSCTRCGGIQCSALPGGAKNCCGGRILTSQVYCDKSMAPCIMV
jgi:peptidoglycan/xylan/chitin deacetylase (PgdA/CDA1 family)